MPTLKRNRTSYPGVYFIFGKAIATNKPERIFYITYRRDGRLIEEKAGRQFRDNMSSAKASRIRVERIEGKQLSNRARREVKKAEGNVWTIERLWEKYKESNPSIKGLSTDQNRFKNYILPEFGNKESRVLAPLDVDRLRIKLLKKKKPATVKNILELLRRIINFGEKKRLAPGPGFKLQMPKINNLKTEDLTQERLTKLLKTIDKDTHPQAGPMMKMVLFTGMRRSELFRLQRKDIDFEKGFLTIRNPKGGEDQKIPLNDAAREVLMNLPQTESPYLFPGRGGNQRTDIKKAVNEIKKKAGLPKDFRPLHGLRHVYASALASSGQVDLYSLQKLLTHKSSSMVQRYAHLRDETLKRASNLAGKLFSQIIEKKGEEKLVVSK